MQRCGNPDVGREFGINCLFFWQLLWLSFQPQTKNVSRPRFKKSRIFSASVSTFLHFYFLTTDTKCCLTGGGAGVWLRDRAAVRGHVDEQLHRQVQRSNRKSPSQYLTVLHLCSIEYLTKIEHCLVHTHGCVSFTRGVCWQESGEKKICVATQRQRYDKIIRTKETVELSLCQICSRSVDLTLRRSMNLNC